MENEKTSETELIIKRVDEKISEIYRRLDLILLTNQEPEEINEPTSSKLIEALTGIENRLKKLLVGIRI